jgi:hypothetical protein
LTLVAAVPAQGTSYDAGHCIRMSPIDTFEDLLVAIAKSLEKLGTAAQEVGHDDLP